MEEKLRKLKAEYLKQVQECRDKGRSDPEYLARGIKIKAYNLLIGQGLDPAAAVRYFENLKQEGQQ